jgi:D-aminopeptidase
MPAPEGFRVFITTDMEGLGSVVFNREIIAGNETERYRQPGSSSPDYWEHYRDILTREVNATIAGARLGGARLFIVKEGHSGNLVANFLPSDLRAAAMMRFGPHWS